MTNIIMQPIFSLNVLKQAIDGKTNVDPIRNMIIFTLKRMSLKTVVDSFWSKITV